VREREEFSPTEAFERNRGLVSLPEQERLSTCLVAIAGCGGVGGLHAHTLARLGVGRFRLSDADTFSLANFNRQIGATVASLGRNKAAVTADMIRAINPEARIEIVPEVEKTTARDFVAGADLIVDGVDFFALEERRALFAAAWRAGIPAVTAAPLGFSGTLHVFAPGGMSFDEYFDLADGQSLFDQLVNFALGLAPGAAHLAYMDLQSVDPASGRGPSSIVGTQMAACLVGAEAVRILLKRGPSALAPAYLQFDAYRQCVRRGRVRGGNRHPLQRVKRAVLARRLRSYGWESALENRRRGRLAAAVETEEPEPARQALEAFVAAAIRAPSGDNMQPWRFSVDAQSGRIALFVDCERDLSPMNAGQRMARISIGAAVENLLQTARANGWSAEREEPSLPALATVVVRVGESPVRPVEAIGARVTNRRVYEGRPVPQDVLARIVGETSAQEGASTHWITDPERLASFASLLSRCDAALFAEPSTRHAFLANVRFDRPASEEVEEGLCLDSLELPPLDRKALGMARLAPDAMWKLKATTRPYARHVRRLVQSASGLCLIVAREQGEQADLDVGSALQRAWLALTQEGLAAQPMMSLLVLENIQDHGRERTLVPATARPMAAFRKEFRALAPEIGEGRPGFLLRFGYASPPTARAGRRPVAAVTGDETLRCAARAPRAPEPSQAQIRRIVEAASRAPSGENCQPWKFHWDGEILSVLHDLSRSIHNLDCRYHASYLALGCLLESISLASSAEGWKARFELDLPDDREAGAPLEARGSRASEWARVAFEPTSSRPDALADTLAWRATDRRLHRGGSLEEPVFRQILSEASRYPSCGLRFQGETSREMLRYLARAETYVWKQPAAHRDLMRWIRFDKRQAQALRDGLPWPSLAINYFQSRVLRLCRSFRVQKLLNRPAFLFHIRRMTKKQIRSSAGLGCLTVRSMDPKALVEAGRLGFRVWLWLNRSGYGFHPMTIGSLSIYNYRAGTLQAGASNEFVQLFASGYAVLRRAFGFSSAETPVWMFRTGLSPALPDAARTPRRRLDEILTISPGPTGIESAARREAFGGG
jgi:molybdopterin/thiamine biosynthesis adenylyltransferase/nitroreductase